MFNKFPFELDLEHKKSADMTLLDNNGTKHFLLNIFYRFYNQYKNIDTIYFTKKQNVDSPVVWQIENCPKYIAYRCYNNRTTWYFETIYEFIPQDDLIRLFKEQLNFIYQKNLTFIEL